MNFKRLWTTAFLLTSVAFVMAAHAADKKKDTSATTITPVKDQRAMNELKKMSEALAGSKSMTFRANSMTPLRGPNHQWLHVFSTAEVSMQRPQELFVQTGGDAYPQKMYYDGKMFSVLGSESKLYSQMKTSGHIDAMLGEVSEKAGDAFPFADVLVSDPLSSWTKDLEGALYVGVSERGGEKLSHLALSAKDVNWEVWIDQKTHLPRMVYVKYITEEHSPSVLIEFSKWKLNSKIPAATFAFKAPAGAKMIEMKAPERTTK